VEWHIITGEYPPQLGGVSDYTYQVSRALAKTGDSVHVWSPVADAQALTQSNIHLHALPKGYSWRWVRQLGRQMASFPGPRNILIQYVPHMYGWKSMNLAFCLWLCLQKRHNVSVMFHEVAFPFQNGQPVRHRLLAIVHRIMAAAILRSVRHSFTSTEPYLALLRNLGGESTPISMLRICSNIPSESYEVEVPPPSAEPIGKGPFTVGIFSNFSKELRDYLGPVIGCILENPRIEIALLGPGEAFRKALLKHNPEASERIRTTGRLHVTQVAERMRSCNALLQIYPGGASAARGTLIAALASGVPVVTTAGPATDKLLLESETMLFSDGSPQSIRETLERLMGNPSVGQELGSNAQRLYKESFEPGVIAARLQNLAARCEEGNSLVTYPAVVGGRIETGL
jgi:glycosyltransferase involved in cell wall biosynthesis